LREDKEEILRRIVEVFFFRFVVGKSSRKGDNKRRGFWTRMTSFTTSREDAKVVTTVMDDEDDDDKRRAHIRATCERSRRYHRPPLIKK
jgi:hypothetical protein